MKARLIVVAFSLGALASLHAGWYVDNSAAAAHLGGSSRLGPYPTEAAAQAVVNANSNYGMRVIPGGSDDTSSSTTTAPAAAGHQFDNVINQGISGGISGKLSGSDAIGVVGLGLLGNALFAPHTADPAEQAAAQNLAIAQQKAAAEAAAAAERKKQADFNRLRGQLKFDSFDGETGGGLVLKGVEVQSDGGLARDSEGKLALKFGDDDLQPQVTRASAKSGAAESPAPNTDPMVVDARNVPSGLPKSVEDVIAEAFSTAPFGVADAVRRGYQAIMAHDMNAAQAWFSKALNQFPSDAGLVRLVDLTSYTLQRERELAASHSSPAPRSSSTSSAAPRAAQGLQLPEDRDVNYLFDQRSRAQVIADDVFLEGMDPGWKKFNADERAASLKAAQDNGNTEQVRLLQNMYQAYDLEKSHVGRVADPAPTPPPSFIIGKDGQLIQVPANTDPKTPTFIKGKAGELIQLPPPSDITDLFPEAGPKATLNPASVKAPARSENDAAYETALHNLGLTTPADARAQEKARIMESIAARKKAFIEKYRDVKAGSTEAEQAKKEAVDIMAEEDAFKKLSATE